MDYSYISIAILLWASSFVGIRAALVGYSPIEVAVLRLCFSSITLLLIIIPGKIKLPDKKDYFSFILLGLVLAINNIALNYGTNTITAGETTFIISTSQLFQVLLAYLFLKETISSRFLLGLFLCFIGIIIVAFQNSTGFSFNIGVIFVLFAAITNAVYFILQKHLLKKYTPLEIISYAIWITTLFMIPFGYNTIEVILKTNIDVNLAVIYIGVAATIANLCWSKVLSKIEASKAAIFLYIIPVMTIIIGFLWLYELPSLISCSGGIIILIGVIISNTKKKITIQLN